MRKPMPPPKVDDLAEALANSDFIQQLARNTRTIAQAPYYHWDEMRHRRPPEGLTREQWWLITKLSRASMQRSLPLVDKGGTPFVYSLTDQILREAEFVSAYARGRIGSNEPVTNPATRDRYLVSSLIEEAITSSQLEGASTTRRVAKDMIRSGREPRDRSEQMILNNFFAMQRVGELRNEKLTPELILEIHRIVTDKAMDDNRDSGRFQDATDDRVGVYDYENNLLHMPPEAVEIPERIRRLCQFANAADAADEKIYLPGVLRALVLHFMIGYEHPFEDGNGRTARALFYWSMLNRGYWMAEFLSVSRILKKAPVKYSRSFLYTETDDGDLTYFFIYHLSVIHRAIIDLDEYLVRKVAEVREIRATLISQHRDFNSRQLALLNYALRNPDGSFSVNSHMTSHRTSMETARQDLNGLENAGLLERARIGKRYVYRPAMDLSEKFRNLSTV